MSARSLDDLEWSRIQAAVAQRCRGPLGARLRLALCATFEGAELALAQTAEALALLQADESFPIDGAVEIGTLLQRVQREGALSAPELRDVVVTLAAARALRLFLSRHKGQLGRLSQGCAFDPTLDHLHEEIVACVESDGTLSDHASPELRRLRTETANLRARIVGKLEAMLHQHSAILQDRFYTIREGRYVVPVRRDAHEKLQGIVHGTSASGHTVFVEPRALVAQGNRLKMAQAEQEREEARILAELSVLVGERLPELNAAIDSIDLIDLRQASARLGVDLGGTVPELVAEPTVDLAEARHPLLVLDGVEVVPADLSLRGGRGLVLSGPNAGGKTVALKTLGLSALMARAGVPICAKPGAQCGFFEAVLSDVGDEQSLQKNLSTFSAHMTNVASIVRDAGRGSLVLLDELATGTDPGEGAALACALLDALCRAGAAVAVTTHYEALKALATRDDRFDNASVGFDVQAMMPTFELHHGTPGASSALAVAARFGIPAPVIDAARAVLPEQSRTFDELVQKLEEQRQSLVLEKAAIEGERRQLQTLREASEKRLEALRSQGAGAVDEASRRLRDELHHARRDLKKARKQLRKQQDDEVLERTRQRIDAATAAMQAAAPTVEEPAGPGLESAEVGQAVWVPRLRSRATVLELDERKGARVQAGPMKLWVALTELRGADEPKVVKMQRQDEAAVTKQSPRTSDNTIDLRGMRVDDALPMMESFLDRLYGAAQNTAYVLHGLGTGALREAIRQHLKRDIHYVKTFRTGTTEEGGDRLTVVTLTGV